MSLRPSPSPPRPRPVVGGTLAALLGLGPGCADLDPEDAGPGDVLEGRCPGEEPGPPDPFADCIEAFAPADEASFGHDALPQIVLGPPVPGGATTGSTDVASLGCGGSITLYFADPPPTDGPGPDLLVFENPFVAGAITFVEPARVEVSDNGVDWEAFPCEPDGTEQGLAGCAGVHPVLAQDAADALDPATAGGDAFDLAELGLSTARFLRLTDLTEAHYGSRTWCMGQGGGFDLDAAAGRGPER